MSVARYRKYRPKTLDDIVGQDTTVKILKQEALEDRFAHAYIFYGPRGTGKTSTARILAKLANCETRKKDSKFAKKGTPCNKCDNCLSIDNGTSMDVIEIDAASNRGIDEIRSIQENINTLPSKSPYKVIIMDEAHMLTQQASNAILKTLEEPPAHVIFILATTEYEKMLSTIISRTQKFHFRKVQLNEIMNKLESIVKNEKISSTKEGLEMIARLADGSVRDAESVLDQIASMRGNVTDKEIEDIIGKTSFSRISKLITSIVEKDLKESLNILYEIQSDGYNLIQFNKDLIEYFRRILSISLNPELEKLFAKNLTESEINNMKKYSKDLDKDFLITLLKELLSAQSKMKYNPLPIVPLEIAIISSIRRHK